MGYSIHQYIQDPHSCFSTLMCKCLLNKVYLSLMNRILIHLNSRSCFILNTLSLNTPCHFPTKHMSMNCTSHVTHSLELLDLVLLSRSLIYSFVVATALETGELYCTATAPCKQQIKWNSVHSSILLWKHEISKAWNLAMKCWSYFKHVHQKYFKL